MSADAGIKENEKYRVKRLVTSVSIIVANKDRDVESMRRYQKLKKILGISDAQLEEFANFKKNEKKLLKMFGSFIDHENETGKPIDVNSAASFIKDVYTDDVHEEKSNKKVKDILGITESSIEAFKSYQQRLPKLKKMLGKFVELDDPKHIEKLEELEKVVMVLES